MCIYKWRPEFTIILSVHSRSRSLLCDMCNVYYESVYMCIGFTWQTALQYLRCVHTIPPRCVCVSCARVCVSATECTFENVYFMLARTSTSKAQANASVLVYARLLYCRCRFVIHFFTFRFVSFLLFLVSQSKHTYTTEIVSTWYIWRRCGEFLCQLHSIFCGCCCWFFDISCWVVVFCVWVNQI